MIIAFVVYFVLACDRAGYLCHIQADMVSNRQRQ